MRRLPHKHPKGFTVFWFLCKKHLTGVYDKKTDLKGRMFHQDKGTKCDYPWPSRCKLKATNEYFPYLVSILKKQKKGKKVPMLRELKEFSK